MVLWLWCFSYGYGASTMVLQPDAARLRGSVMGWSLFKLAEMCTEAATVKWAVKINSWAFSNWTAIVNGCVSYACVLIHIENDGTGHDQFYL